MTTARLYKCIDDQLFLGSCTVRGLVWVSHFGVVGRLKQEANESVACCDIPKVCSENQERQLY
jgi:hypothetical protein